MLYNILMDCQGELALTAKAHMYMFGQSDAVERAGCGRCCLSKGEWQAAAGDQQQTMPSLQFCYAFTTNLVTLAMTMSARARMGHMLVWFLCLQTLLTVVL